MEWKAFQSGDIFISLKNIVVVQSIVPHYCSFVDAAVLLCVAKIRAICYLSGLYQLVLSCTLNNKYSTTALVQSLLTSLCAFVCVCMCVCYKARGRDI